MPPCRTRYTGFFGAVARENDSSWLLAEFEAVTLTVSKCPNAHRDTGIRLSQLDQSPSEALDVSLHLFDTVHLEVQSRVRQRSLRVA